MLQCVARAKSMLDLSGLSLLTSAINHQYVLLKLSAPLMGSAFKCMVWFVCTFWVLLSQLLLFFLGNLYGYLSRLQAEKRDDQFGMELFQTMERFLFGEAEGFPELLGEGRSVEEEEGSSIGTSRYQFFGGDSLSRFIEEPKAASFTAHELFVDSPHQSRKDPEKVTTGVSAEKGFQEYESDAKPGLRGVEFSISLDAHDNKAHEEESEKHEQANSAPKYLTYEEPDDRRAGSCELDDVVCDHDRDEKMMASCSSSGDEHFPEKQRLGVEAEFCPENHRFPAPHVDLWSISSNEDMIGLELDVHRVFGGQSSSSTSFVSPDTKESVGPVINGYENIDIINLHATSPSKVESHDDAGICFSGRLVPSDPEQESVGSNDPGSDCDEKTEVTISRSSSEEKLEAREQETFFPDDLPQMEDTIRPLFSFLPKHEFSDGSTMNSMYHEVPLDSKSTSSIDDFRCAEEENGSEPREAFPVIISADEKSEHDTLIVIHEEKLDYDAEDGPASVKSSIDMNDENLLHRQLNDGSHNGDEENSVCEVSESMQSSDEPDEREEEEEEEEDCTDHDSDDEMEEDVAWEHKERVRHMSKELTSCITIGLPTILEESESPGLEGDLMPLKIDSKGDYRGCMDEIQLFYKSYSEKMRKLDIFSRQTLNAIGLVELKNQDQLSSKRSKSLLPFRLRRHDSSPVKMLIRHMQRELEVAYVGQLCLSWEILKWQCGKALDLQDYDTWGSRQYSIAAREFQQFHVHIQRFTEDEPFQEPRIQYYMRSQSIQCNLLRVPLVKEDSKNGRRAAGEGAITITMLLGIMEESMRAYWEFLIADKGEAGTTLKGSIRSNPDLQDPSDMELLTDICTILQKKERRLKDSIRSRSCIVKKFQKHKKRRLDHDIFLAQVELRLVSRVVRMSKLTTDQLLWCHKKLGNVNFVGREVNVDSSFLFFPC